MSIYQCGLKWMDLDHDNIANMSIYVSKGITINPGIIEEPSIDQSWIGVATISHSKIETSQNWYESMQITVRSKWH